MKRFVSSIVITVAALLMFSACNKMLDKAPLDSFADDNFWTKEANVEAYANTFFNNFAGYGNSGGGGSFYFPTLNDNQADASFRDWNYNNVLVTNSDWTSPYVEIRRANILISRVEKMDIASEAKAHWTGVARLIRALQYYWLVRTFGDVPLVDHELNISETEVIFQPRQDRDKVMDFVLDDLDFAVTNIRDVVNRTGWSRDLAQAIKAEICLFEGTYCKYRVAADGQKAPDTNRATAFLTAAKTAASAIMAKGAYVLNTTYASTYNSLDLTGSKEMILTKHYAKDVFMHSLPDYTCSSSQAYGLTKDAFNAYLFTDGLPKATTTKNNTDIPTVMDAAQHLTITDLLAVRDPRLSAAIDGTLMTVPNPFKGRFGRSDDVNQTSSTGYGVLKYDSKDLAVGYRVETGKNYTDAPLYWLAVIYLEYAEACAELGACTQSDLDNSINKLRDRVGMPHLTTTPAADPANNMGVSALIWEIRRERRVELMFDNNFRFWDLNRWHQLDKLDTKQYPDIKLGANVKNDPTSMSSTDITVTADGYINAYPNNDRIYDKKYYFYPVPTSQIQLNEKLTQNPGWEK